MIEAAETNISLHTRAGGSRPRRGKFPLPSVAAGTWLLFLMLATFQFDEAIGIVAGPADGKIERDLTAMLRSTARSLESYQELNEVLPPFLPNPAVRGLVFYERRSDFRYRLSATISDVTMVMESGRAIPYRLDEGAD